MLFSLLYLVGLAIACPEDEHHARDGHAHAHMFPPTTLTPPSNPLTWGDFNVIHTTDTHGWLFGHQKTDWPEPYYSGDLGDFASFEKDVDLLLVDSGDVHDGTGFSDGYPPGGVDAHESNKFLELPYDLMTIGNHELYVYADAYDMYTNFVPNLNGRYLSSNVNITVFDSNGNVVSVPVGNQFVKFTTGKGRKVTWWPTVFNTIRNVHPYTPILIFGGHTHIRDCQQYDGRSMALESGRYMETIGSWISSGADLDAAAGNTNDVTFTRRYLDQNRVTYEYHTQTSNSTFDTDAGRNITSCLHQLAVDFDLSYLYGTAPSTYTMNQDKYPSDQNVLSLYVAEAAPVALAVNNSRAGTPNIIIINSEELRYNVFAGPFTKNDQLTAVPFTDPFYYIPDVPFDVANQVLPALNSKRSSKRSEVEKELWDRGRRFVVVDLSVSLSAQGRPGQGDDTPHEALTNHRVPNYVGSNAPDSEVLNELQSDTTYTKDDVSLYTAHVGERGAGCVRASPVELDSQCP
ncbi:Metallo-dependent phosphatase-like protein [Tylopilus felleus]